MWLSGLGSFCTYDSEAFECTRVGQYTILSMTGHLDVWKMDYISANTWQVQSIFLIWKLSKIYDIYG